MKNLLRPLSIVLTLCFIASFTLCLDDAWAKRRSRSFSSRKRSSFSRKKSKPKGSLFRSTKKTTKTKKTYTSRSKTRSKKGSVFNANSRKTSRGSTLAQAARRADSKSKFMQAGKGKTSSKTYREVVRDNSTLRDSLTTNNAKTRTKRRKTYYDFHSPSNTYYRYSPRVVYRDPYDNFFFRYVTMTWLFHHWNHIDKSRFEEDRLRELEEKIAEMEAQGLERDPDYVMPGGDPDLQYSDEELENLQEAGEVLAFESEAAEEKDGGFGWFTLFLLATAAAGGVYFVAVRRY